MPIAGKRPGSARPCYRRAMAAFPCPYCGHALASGDNISLERCPSCDGALLIAYRYRLVAAHGKIAGGELYEALDDGFAERVAVLFAEQSSDPAAVDRFIEGSRLFADLGGRGLVKIHDVGTHSDRRAYVIMDWLEGGTLDTVVSRGGPLQQAALLELIGDLLTGVSKAHRAMPAIVHGHIHAGKIGFRRKGEVVLFGFEWATQVNAQASHLADSFMSEKPTQERRAPASDLRQLAVVFHYAATADWIGEQPLEDQREHVRAQVPGPLGRLLDRMLGAGVDGYKSAVEAAIDFEQLMRGIDSWQAPRSARKDHSADRMGTAWTNAQGDDDEEEDHEDDEDSEEIEEYVASIFEPQTSAPKPASARPMPDWAAVAAQRQAQAQAQVQPKPANPGRTLIVAVTFMVVIGTCVAGILADVDNTEQQVDVRRAPPIEPIPREAAPVPTYEEPALPEPPPLPEPTLAPATPALAGVFRYTGEITGPEKFAGLKLGERCEIFIEPNEGELNCRWYIDCGKPRRRIYGGGDVGYSTCEVDEQGHPLRADDEDDDAPDGAFLADFTTDPRLLIVHDRWIEPPVNVLISIEEGGLWSGSIPNTKLAPRDSQEEVQARIDRDEWPVVEPGVIGKW